MMMTHIKQFLTPPVFEDDYKTRQSKLLHTIIKLTLLILIIPALIAIATSQYHILSLIPLVSTLILFIIILVLLRRGYVHFASKLYVSINWLIIMTTAIFFGGVNGSAFPFFIIPVIMAGLLLSWQVAVRFTMLTILVGFVLLCAEFFGLLPRSLETISLINISLIRIFLLIITIGLVYIATHHLNNALEHELKKAEGRTAELTAANEQLQREINERKQTERQLEQQRNFAMTVMETLGQGVTVSEYEKGFVYVNPAYARMLGYEVEELLGKFPIDFTLPADEIILKRARAARQAGKTTSYELRMQRKDGAVAYVFVTGVPYRVNDKVVGNIAITTDLTERKRIEEEHLARERYLALLNDITLAALETSGLREMLQLLADRLNELIGADGCYITLWDEANQKTIPAAAYGELRETYPTAYVKPGEATMTESVLRAGHALVAEDVFDTPYISPRIAGLFPTCSMLGLPLISGNRKLGAALIGFNQPHHFTQAEIKYCEQAARLVALAIAKAQLVEALQESEAQAIRSRQRLEDAIESLTEAFALYDADDRLVLCNSKCLEFYDLSADLLTPGARFEDHIRGSAYRGQIAEAIGREEEWVQERVKQHQNPQGDYLQQLGSGRWLRISERKTREGGIVGVRTDITELIEKEQALQASERYYHGLFEDSPISLWEQDFSAVKVYIDDLQRQGIEDFRAFFEEHPEAVEECVALVKVVDMNQAAVELYGASTKSNLLGSLDKLMGAEAHRSFREELIYISQGKTHFRAETINTTLTGEKIYIDLSWSVAPGYEDTFSKVYISIIDMTQRKKAEEALRESQKRLDLFFSQSLDGFFFMMLDEPVEWNENTAKEQVLDYIFTHLRITKINDTMLEIYGATREQMLNLTGRDIYGSNLLEGKTRLRRLYDQGSLYIEKEQRRFDGSLVWVEGYYVCLHDNQGRIAGHFGTIRDVTTRKQTEQALRESEERIRQIIDLVPHFIFAKDREGRFIFANRASAESLGIAPEAIGGKLELDLLPIKQDAYAFQKADLEVISGGHKKFIPEETMTDIHGNLHYLQTIKIPFTAPGTQETAVLGVAVDITERKLAEEALRESEERFRATFEQAAVGIAHVGLDGRWLRVNQKLCDIVGYSREELLNQSFTDFTYPDTLEANREYIQQLVAGQIPNYTLEKRYIHKEGTLIWANVTVSLLRSPSGEPKYLISVIEDISRRKRLEEQLRQSQKLEAIGRLAGGIAHDFNNILTIIIGNSELALLSLAEDDPLYADISQIGQVAERAASLTRQLLAFSRQQVLQPITLNLNTVVINIETLLRRLIGEHIELVTLLEPKLGQVKADPSQIEQVIINLAVNARDVMPYGGKLTIETANTMLDRAELDLGRNFEPGLYIMLAIGDTGPGIAPGILAHIFEPFFTTKEVGQGTGLGLATVHGIIEQSGGFIKVDSILQQGTTFKIFLPGVEQAIQPTFTQPAALPPAGGFETILLVEDEEQVRGLARQILETNGYDILEATNGPAALQLAQQHQLHIHLLITDVLMPGGLSGPQLAQELTILYPHLKVLYMSGYPHNTLADQGLVTPTFAFIEKPFTPQQLTQKIRQVLDE